MAKIRSPEELKTTTGLITIEEASGFLLMCVPKLYTAAKKGTIPSFKIGNSRRFKIADLENYVEQHRAA